MPRRRREAKRRELSHAEWLWFWIGVAPDPFPTWEAGREAWERAGGEDRFGGPDRFGSKRPGHRSAGWWEYESGADGLKHGDCPDGDEEKYDSDQGAIDLIEDGERFELAQVVFLAEHGHMDAEEASAFVDFWAGYLKTPRELVDDYWCDWMHHKAVRMISAMLEAFPGEDFADVLGARVALLAS